jgi:hypothetical protein
LIDNDEDAGADDDSSTTCINIVDAHKLNEVELDKKGFMGYIKGTNYSLFIRKRHHFNHLGYLKTIKGKLEEQGKEGEEVKAFMRGATALTKHLVSKWDEVQIFTGSSFDMDAGMLYCYQVDQDDEGPTFFMYLHGTKEEKF